MDKKDIKSIVFKEGNSESDVLDFIFDFDQVDGWSKVKPISFEIK